MTDSKTPTTTSKKVTNSQTPNTTPKPAVEKEKSKEIYIRVLPIEHVIEITYVPALYQIVDEIFVNAANNKVRDQEINVFKFDIDKEGGQFSIFNNGKGIY
ncbi:7738_t:CDS:2 [Funneliformis geosporum]|nr:7738_t:CDS:2 [Funneliformis geosporum]